MEFIDVANQYARQDVGEPAVSDEQERDLKMMIPSSMAVAVEQAENNAEAQDWILATMGAIDFFNESEELGSDVESTKARKKKHSIMDRILHWLGHKIIHRMEKAVFSFIRKQLFKVIRWIVDEAIRPIFRYAVEELVTPVLETIVAAVASPEFLVVAGIAAVAAGLGFIGEWLFEKYFRSGSEPAGSAKVGLEGGGQTASPPVAAGEATVPTAQVAPPPISSRSTLGGKTFSQLEALIQTGESRKKGYDDYNYSTIGNKHEYAGKPVSEMTVAEVQANQAAHNYNAVGRYQMISSTLAAAVSFLHIDPQAKFDADMQDYIFENYLITRKQQAIGDYIMGRSDDLWGAVYAASKEWASVAAPPGYSLAKGGKSDGLTSYYSGVQGNRASISATAMAQVLEQERQNYAAGNSSSGGSLVRSGVTTENPQQQSSANASQPPAKVAATGGSGYSTPNIIKHQGVLLAVNG
jgi:muramidase (phage lysozyme)